MKVLVITQDKTYEDDITNVASHYRVSIKQILWAIKSGHCLKQARFDLVEG